jgi:alkanesulfonate monooxygenase SsuD/methylene tetrahydromethanopterin reductase-like flavin-dependent oxidoreductase (luciferase family)
MTARIGLAVALEGYGWHPEAWRIGGETRPVTDGGYWAELGRTAEKGLLDFVTFDDGLTPQRRRRPEIAPQWLAGRPDAVLVAARVATATRHLGLIPVATVTHTRPAQIAKAIAALDQVSGGRGGWQPRISSTDHEAALFGHPQAPDPAALFDDAATAVESVRRSWGSWAGEASGPPQGQPVVAALAHQPKVYEFAARSADLVFITPSGDDSLRSILGEVADAGGGKLKVYADVYVAFGEAADTRTDAMVFGGTAEALVELLLRWQGLGVDGFRLRPGDHASDLPAIVAQVIPILQRAGHFRTSYDPAEDLRTRLGLPVADDRYAKVARP